MKNQFTVGPAVMQKYARKAGVKSAFGIVNSSHPGQNMGLTLEQVQEMVANAEKAQGTRFTSAVGLVNITPQLPNTAKYIVGISFSRVTNPADQFTLTVNNEKVFTEAGVTGFTKSEITGGETEDPYFNMFRPIAGSTSLSVDYFSLAGGDEIVFTVFYV